MKHVISHSHCHDVDFLRRMGDDVLRGKVTDKFRYRRGQVEMVVRLRLARHGSKNNPFYHVVAIRDKAARDARPIEKLGEYDPIPRPRAIDRYTASTSAQRVTSSGLGNENTVMEKRLEWNAARLQYWLGVGAQPSKPVARLMDKAGLIPEGKSYKGVYRPPRGILTQSTSSDTGLSSAVLQAAGASPSQKDVPGAAASALSQEEVAYAEVNRTDPKKEALKSETAETTIDQAA